MQWYFWAGILGTSFWLEWLTIRASNSLHLGVDKHAGVQKFHAHRVSRLGGVGVFVAMASGLLAISWVSHSEVAPAVCFIVCLLPAFGIGLLEDLTGQIGVRARLVFTMAAAALGWWLLGAHLTRLSIPLVDALLAASPLVALLLTVLAASGIAHAVNIIDGYNGLSGFFCAVVCLALAYVAHQVGDVFVTRAALVTSAAICGFLVLNYPYGLIFLGDAGAYLLGFVIGELSIMLVARHPQVSPWFPLLLAIYPVWETLFSIYRKKVLRGISPGQPDGLHFHMLVYKRLVKMRFSANAGKHKLMRNSATSPYLWILTCLTVAPAVLFWDREPFLIAAALLFVGGYLWLYWAIIRFRTPALIVLSPGCGTANVGPLDVSNAPEP